MHQQSADCVQAVATRLVPAAVHRRGEAHGLRPLAPPGDLRRVMEHQDRAVAGGEPVPRRIEMAPKNALFTHPLVGEEAIGRLRAGPVLAGQRDALSEPGTHAFDQSTGAGHCVPRLCSACVGVQGAGFTLRPGDVYSPPGHSQTPVVGPCRCRSLPAVSAAMCEHVAVVLFDFEWTLFDSAPDAIAVLNRQLGQIGHAPVAFERFRRRADQDARHTLLRALVMHGPERLDDETLRLRLEGLGSSLRWPQRSSDCSGGSRSG